MIDGVVVKDAFEVVDTRGSVQRMVRADDDSLFAGFGEIYFSTTNPGVVKAWHRQASRTNVLSCVRGMIRLVLYDARGGSKTHGALEELEMGDGLRKVVRVPPGVIYGWRNSGDVAAILANCASEPHNPDASEKIDPGSSLVPYVW